VTFPPDYCPFGGMMSLFKCKTINAKKVVVIYVTADKCNYFPNDYLLGSFAQFYQDGYQVKTVYQLIKKPVELKDPKRK
jgi:hypothetical protein